MSKSRTSFPFSLGAFQHRVFRAAALAVILVGLARPGLAGETYPVSATLIPWADRANLQQRLEEVLREWKEDPQAPMGSLLQLGSN